MQHWLVPFIAFDIVMSAIVLMVFLRVRGAVWQKIGVDFKQLRGFSAAAAPKIAEYMRCNYSGNPDALPGVLTGLLDVLERDAKDQGLPLTRPILKSIMTATVSRLNVAKGRELQAAAAQVPDQAAAA
jgi:hypothetical protein